MIKRKSNKINSESLTWDQLIPETAISKMENAQEILAISIDRALRTLTEKEALVLKMRFGLMDATERTLKEVG